MKRTLGLVVLIGSFALILTGCNSFRDQLVAQRDANVAALVYSYETALDSTQTDFHAMTENQYETELQDDMVITGFELASGTTREEIADRPLFSINRINELRDQYQTASDQQISNIDATYDRFHSELTSSSASIEYINQQIAEIDAQRAETVKKTVIGIGSAIGTLLVGASAM